MSQPRQDPAPIIAASLNYWSGWVNGLNNLPTPAFAQKHELILYAVKMGLGLAATRRAAVDLTLATFLTVLSGGYWPAWQPVLETARAHAWPDLDPGQRIRLLSRLGQCYRLDGQFAQAAAIHHEAEELAAQSPDNNLLACEIAFQLAEDYRRQSEYAQAREHALNAWKRVKTNEEQKGWRASITNTIGLIDSATGQLDEADRWFVIAANLHRELSQPVELSRTLNNLGNVLQAQAKVDEALIIYQQALAQLADMDVLIEKLKVQYNIGVIYFDKEQYEKAETIFREANMLIAQQPSTGAIYRPYVFHSLGNAIYKQGRFGEAEPFLRQAVKEWQILGDQLNEGNSLGVLAGLLTGQGQIEAACSVYRQALALLAQQQTIPWGERLYKEYSQDYLALDCPES
jgi:tetratricopeptide (TPR) repeat protein